MKNIILRNVKYILSKKSTFRTTFLLPAWRQIPKTYTQSHDISSQEPTEFTHDALETAWINNNKDQCILGLHPQSPRHCKWQTSGRGSQILWHPYLSHVISSYCQSRRIQANVVSTYQQKHTDLRAHEITNSHGL